MANQSHFVLDSWNIVDIEIYVPQIYIYLYSSNVNLFKYKC